MDTMAAVITPTTVVVLLGGGRCPAWWIDVLSLLAWTLHLREWAKLRQDEILANWESARRNEPLHGIEPLS